MELIIFGLLQTVINTLSIQLVKRLGLSQEAAFAVIALFFGALYYIFVSYLPVNIKNIVVLFVMGTMAGAKILYDLFKKYQSR